MGQLNVFRDKSKLVKYKDVSIDMAQAKDLRHATYGSAPWTHNPELPKHRIKKGSY